MSKLQEKLATLASPKPSTWKEDAAFRRKNRPWLKKSAAIALRVLNAMHAQQISQKDLAARMDVSPQQVNKIVSGSENLTLETIWKLEKALGIVIIDDLPPAGAAGKKTKVA